MFDLSEKARVLVKKNLKGRSGESPAKIRIMPTMSDWGTPALGMALDEPDESDVVFDDDGFQFVIDKQLYDIAKPIHVDSDFVDSKEELSISCTITENFCPLADDPSSCTGYCFPTTLCPLWQCINERGEKLPAQGLGFFLKGVLGGPEPVRRDFRH